MIQMAYKTQAEYIGQNFHKSLTQKIDYELTSIIHVKMHIVANFITKASYSLYLPSLIFLGSFLHVSVEIWGLNTIHGSLHTQYYKTCLINHRHLGLFPDAFYIKYKYIYDIKGHQIWTIIIIIIRSLSY